MSPSAFRDQISQLLCEIRRSNDLCDAIRMNRNLVSSTPNLDQLQESLQQSLFTIKAEYDALRRFVGSRMHLGDEIARQAISRAVRELQLEIEVQLSGLASTRISRSGEMQLPGFRDLYKRWSRIEGGVLDALVALSQRLQHPIPILKTSSRVAPTPPPVSHAAPRVQIHPPRLGEGKLPLKQVEHLIDHMKDCWTEQRSGGRSYYVNAFDNKKRQWERPSGFIQSLPKEKKREEERMKDVREDYGYTIGW